jgi:hypothetical protein
MVVEKFDHVTSLMASIFLSFIPIVLFAFMPETVGVRTHRHHQAGAKRPEKQAPEATYRAMA